MAFEPDYPELKKTDYLEAIARLKSQVEFLEDELSDMEYRYEDAQRDLDYQEGLCYELEDRVEELEQEVSELHDELDNFEQLSR